MIEHFLVTNHSLAANNLEVSETLSLTHIRASCWWNNISFHLFLKLVSVAHWHSARRAWNGYQPDLGSIPRPGRI